MISHCASLVGFKLLVFLFSQIQQDDCSAAWPILCAAVLLHRPVTPNAENNRQTDCAGNPLHPTSTPSALTFSSLESFSVITSIALPTLYSSTNDVKGSCNFDVLLYRPIDVKIGGKPGHFLRCLLMVLSSFSTVVAVIS